MSFDAIKQFLARFLSGQYTREEHQLFITWLNSASMEDVAAVAEELQEMMKNNGDKNIAPDTDLINKIEARLDEYEKQKTGYSHSNNIWFFRSNLFRAAAIFIGLIVAGAAVFYFLKQHRNNIPSITYLEKKVPTGKVEKLTLGDGTIITLNAATTLKYPQQFTGKNREVFLNGEAYFLVKHNANHPFIIHTKYIDIQDVGTEFNVKAYSQDKTTEATLIKGAIEIVMKENPASRILLTPYEKGTFYNDEDRFTKSPADSNNAQHAADEKPEDNIHFKVASVIPRAADSLLAETAWMKNELIFKSESFDDLARSMERWYGVQIIFNSPQVQQYRFTGTFTNETIHQALTELQMIRPFHFTIHQQQIIITP